MKYFFTVIAVFVLFACNNGPGDADKPIDDSLTIVKAATTTVSGPPPARVSGNFVGELPCADCEKTGVLLTLTESGYEKTQHKVAPKIKSDLLSSQKGICMQDSGLITLNISQGKSTEKYKIISIDSLEYMGSKGKRANSNRHYYLIRNDGKKIVQ
jgi:hypothetical protein